MNRPRFPSSPERRLVIALARLALGAEDRREARQVLAGDLEWTAIVDRLARHHVGPLLHHHLRDPVLAERVPATARERLERSYLRSWYESERLHAELGRVLAALVARGVDAVVLKGAALALPLYRDPALRSMGDIDLLVRPEAIAQASACLTDLGYTASPAPRPHWDPTRRERHGPPFIHDSGLIIEVHHNVQTRPFAVDLASWWPAVVTTELGGQPARVLGREHGALHLLFHHAFHLNRPLAFGQRLRQLCDIRETIASTGEGFRWPLFIQELVRHGRTATAAVLGELLALDRAYGALPLPPALTELATPRAAFLARLAELDLAVDAAEAIHMVRSQVLLGVSPLRTARDVVYRLTHHRAFTGEPALAPTAVRRVGGRAAINTRGFARVGAALLATAWRGWPR